MSSDPRSPLERNLQRLFARAYAPVEIRAEFEARARRAVLAAASLHDRGPASTAVSWRDANWSSAVWALAASFALACFATRAWFSSDARRDSILARGDVALRAESGAWRGRSFRGADAAPERVTLAESLHVVAPSGAVAGLLAGDAAIALAGPADARVQSQGAFVDLRLDSGGLALRGYSGRLRGSFGLFELDAADLDFQWAPAGSDHGPSGAIGAAHLLAGRARFASSDGSRLELSPGDFVNASAALAQVARPSNASEVAALVPFAGVERRPVQPPPVESAPAASEQDPTAPADLSVEVRFRGEAPPRVRAILLREVELPRTAEPDVFEFDGAPGTLRLDAVDPGRWTVFVQAEGYALWTREHLDLGEQPAQLEVELAPGLRVEGRVFDASSGAALAGAMLVSESDVPAMLLPFAASDVADHNPAAIAYSDADGRFVFEHLAARSTVVRATALGRAPAWSRAFVPGDGFSPRLDLRVGGSIAGRVQREDASASSGSAIIAMPMAATSGLPRRSFGLAAADVQGEFRIDDLPAGQHVIVRLDPPRESTPGAPPRTEVREATVRAGETTRVDFLAPLRASRFAGRVLDSRGKPLAAATLSIVPMEKSPDGNAEIPLRWRSQLCSALGAFEFTDVEPGEYGVYLAARSPRDIVRVASVEVRPHATLAQDIVAPNGALHGTIRSRSSGEGLMFAVVVLELEDPTAGPVFVGKLSTDEHGAWRAPFLAPGRYRVTAFGGRGLAFAARSGVEVGEGEHETPLDFVLEPGSQLRVRVRTVDGAPAAFARVRLFDATGMQFDLDESMLCDEKGERRFEGLPEGALRLRVESPDGTWAERDLRASPPEPVDVEIQLEAR